MNNATKEQIRVYLSEDTCRLAAQLRASYDASGLGSASLAQVIEDAIEFFHYKTFEARAVPSNWQDFTKTRGPHG